ncbi:MAG: type II toxin-antitoxin system RelE/ParE family toxin [Steroidobacteraceae bacterium]
MYEIRRSTAFDAWLTNLNDSNARARIAARIDRLALGNPGDVKPVGAGVSELRIAYGPGYRVYYARTDRVRFRLLCSENRRRGSDVWRLELERPSDLLATILPFTLKPPRMWPNTWLPPLRKVVTTPRIWLMSSVSPRAHTAE